MHTKKEFKAAIFWKDNFEDDFFAEMLNECDGLYGVLIAKGFNSPVNVLCIFKGAEKDKIFVQSLPSLNQVSFAMKKIIGFALLNQVSGRTVHRNGNTLDNRRCNLRFPKTEKK